MKALSLLLLLPAAALAQAGPSQARLEEDCRQRLEPLVPAGVARTASSFSALGSYASYYVVSHRFSSALKNGSASAACTYRRDGLWVRDDASSWKLAQQLAARPARAD